MTLRNRIFASLLAGGLALAFHAPALRAQEESLAPEDEGGGLEELTGEQALPLQITGFGVAGYRYDGRTDDNSFAGSKIAVSAFRELSESVWFFGQLTTLLEQSEEAEEAGNAVGQRLPSGYGLPLSQRLIATRSSGGGAEESVVTEIEIDNLIVNFTPPTAPELSFFLGKFDDPLGFERDDEPLNLLPTTSFNFQHARPLKLVGFAGRWNIGPQVNLLGMVANGWDAQIDSNTGKTVGGRLGILPTGNSNLGVGGLFGPETEAGEPAGETETHDRYLLSIDYAWQPTPAIILAGEANFGGERDAAEDGSDATWAGATLIAFGRLSRRFGLAVRGEIFDDRDGERTGEVQTLRSLSLAPVLFFGTGRNGIFANVEHTTFRIPRFQVRGEVRLDDSDVEFFDTGEGRGDWTVRYILQLVATF